MLKSQITKFSPKCHLPNIPGSIPFMGLSISGTNPLDGGYVQRGGYVWGVSMSREMGIHPPPLLTPSGGHHTYGRQASGTRHIGMLSCC